MAPATLLRLPSYHRAARRCREATGIQPDPRYSYRSGGLWVMRDAAGHLVAEVCGGLVTATLAGEELLALF
jgi:hypothetical protein